MIEALDAEIPKLAALKPDVLIVTGDHSTPSRMKSHSFHPVPLLLWAPATGPPRLRDHLRRAPLPAGRPRPDPRQGHHAPGHGPRRPAPEVRGVRQDGATRSGDIAGRARMRTIDTTIVVDDAHRGVHPAPRRRGAGSAPRGAGDRGDTCEADAPDILRATMWGRGPKASPQAGSRSMTTPVAVPDPIVVDRNILVFANAPTAPFHLAAVANLNLLAALGVELCINRQILREYLATLSRPQFFGNPVPASILVADIGRFESQFRILEDGPIVTSHLVNFVNTIPCGGKQIHDANIVATMLAHGISRILTHNTADFARFAAIVTVLTI